MHWIDWLVLAGVAVFISIAAYRTKRYTHSVADFLVANRCAGKYLLGVGDFIAGMGAVSFVAIFQQYYKTGFTASWWGVMGSVTMLLVGVTGWIQYRFRQTRAMTMAQFFEIRYSRRFRIFAGILAFTSGTINLGIFPAVGARFFQYYCGLSTYPVAIGPLQIDLVFAAIMVLLLAIALAFTFAGGQIAVIVTDFLQGTFSNIMFVVIAIFLFYKLDWSQVAEAVAQAPPNASLVNPMKTSGTETFNFMFYAIMAFGSFLTFMAWQGNQGYFGAAISPHEAKMGRVLATLRGIPLSLLVVLMPIAAYTLMHHSNFSQDAEVVNGVLETIPNAEIRDRMTVPIVLTQLLPVGILGGFAAVMFAAFVSTHDTYLHSWGSIFVQDVVMPIRQAIIGTRQPMSAQGHMKWLRGSILGVATFVFFFALFFSPKQDVLLYFALTGNIYLGWAGAVIVGGLYWRYGTTAGAWSASIWGMSLAALGWFLIRHWGVFVDLCDMWVPSLQYWIIEWRPKAAKDCPFNAQELWMFSMISSGLLYIIVSLISGALTRFDLDKLLHRGKYAVESTGQSQEKAATGWKIFGIGKECTFGDRCIFIASYAQVTLFVGVFLIGTIYALSFDVSDSAWFSFWKGYCWFMLVAGIFVTVWLTIGGVRDFRRMFRLLNAARHDTSDDGSGSSSGQVAAYETDEPDTRHMTSPQEQRE